MNNREMVEMVAEAVAAEVTSYLPFETKLSTSYWVGINTLKMKKWDTDYDEEVGSWEFKLGGKFLKISDEASMTGWLRAFVLAYNYAIEQTISALEYAEGIVEKEMEDA